MDSLPRDAAPGPAVSGRCPSRGPSPRRGSVPNDEAIDVRTETAGIDQDTAQQIADDLSDRLGNDYDVVVEDIHIHIEYDPDDDD